MAAIARKSLPCICVYEKSAASGVTPHVQLSDGRSNTLLPTVFGWLRIELFRPDDVRDGATKARCKGDPGVHRKEH